MALLIGAVGADRPLDGQGDDRRALYRWLRDHTEPHEVVACTDRMLACSIRHFARRPVFMATNFPFNPAYIADFGQRLELQDALEDAADADSISQLSDRYGVRVILAPTADLPASEVVEGVAVGPLHLHRVAAEPAP